MSKALNNHLDQLPESVQQEIKQLQKDSEALKNLCVTAPGEDLHLMGHIGHACYLLSTSEQIEGRHDAKVIHGRVSCFLNRFREALAYTNNRFNNN